MCACEGELLAAAVVLVMMITAWGSFSLALEEKHVFRMRFIVQVIAWHSQIKRAAVSGA